MTIINDPMQTREYAEKYLMGSWLAEENREYIKYFDDGEFIYLYDLFKEIKKGKTLKNNLELSKSAKTSVQEQIALLELYNSFPRSQQQQYFRAYSKQIINENMIKYITTGNQDTETIDHYREKIRIIQAPEEVKQETSKDWFSEYVDEIAKRKELKPLKFDIPKLNAKLGGLNRGELTTLAARPGVGKSTFALQTAEAIANEGHKVLYFNLEMTMSQIGDRLLTKHTEISPSRLKEGTLTQDEWDQIAQTGALNNIVKNISFKQINNNIDYFKNIIEEEDPELVIIDQLSHLNANFTAPNLKEKFTYMVETLKKIAITRGIPILLLAQLSRNADNKGEPTLADLKESGSIEETSDNVLMLYTQDENPDEGKAMIPCVIKIAKNRQGAQGYINVIFHKSRYTFKPEGQRDDSPSTKSRSK